MRTIILFLLLATLSASAQTYQTPAKNDINLGLIRNEQYKMALYVMKDTSKIQLAEISTEIKKINNRLLVKTTVEMNTAVIWIDSTLAALPNLKPLRHTSDNQQRDLVLNFGAKVTGYYSDKAKNQKTTILEQGNGDFFDSNLYPQIIRWLPLHNSYTTTIAIFDYNPNIKAGLMTATIKATKEGVLDGSRVWIVSVTDDINLNQVKNTYYIDIKTHSLLRQEIDRQGQKMLMELIPAALGK